MDNIVTATAIITGLTEVVKRAGVNTKYIPLVAIFFGLVYGVALGGFEVTSIIGGIVAGLTSVGLYRTGQKIVQ